MTRNALNHFTGFFCLLALCLAAVPATAGIKKMGIAAIVNDDIVTFSDISHRLKLYLSGAPQKPSAQLRAEMEQKVLNRLIDEKLQLQEAKNLGIVINDQQIKSGFDEIARQNKLTPEVFRDKLLKSGVPLTTLQDQLRAEIAWSQVIRRKLRPQINVSESEIDSEITQIARDPGKPEYHIAEIFLAVKDPKKESTVKKKADKLIAAMQKGKLFSQTAREESEAPGAATGGDIGWISADQLPAALGDVVVRMRPGELSSPIRSEKGFHIIFLRNTRTKQAALPLAAAPQPRAQSSGDDAKGDIVHIKQIMIPISDDDPAVIANAKIARATSLKDEIRSCAAMDKKMKDFSASGTGDMGKGPLAALPLPVQQKVAPLKIGELSDPLRGDNGVAVMMVCAREKLAGVAPAPSQTTAATTTAEDSITAAAAPNVPDAARDAVASKIGLQRLDQMQERYLRDLRATAFIDKRN